MTATVFFPGLLAAITGLFICLLSGAWRRLGISKIQFLSKKVVNLRMITEITIRNFQMIDLRFVGKSFKCRHFMVAKQCDWFWSVVSVSFRSATPALLYITLALISLLFAPHLDQISFMFMQFLAKNYHIME